MKKIGTLETNYHIYQKSVKTFVIQFEVGSHTISLANLKYCDWMSEETTCFQAELVIDGKSLGICSNDGHGGCANYYCNCGTREESIAFYELVRDITREVEQIEDYCFPKMKMRFPEMLDQLASFVLTFRDNDVTTATRAKAVINALQQTADGYRERYKNK